MEGRQSADSWLTGADEVITPAQTAAPRKTVCNEICSVAICMTAWHGSLTRLQVVFLSD